MTGSSVGCSGVRAVSVLCTNTTGKPIGLNVSTGTTAATTLYFVINGVVVFGSSYSASGGQVSGIAVVPNGGTYAVFLSAGGPNGFIVWRELR